MKIPSTLDRPVIFAGTTGDRGGLLFISDEEGNGAGGPQGR